MWKNEYIQLMFTEKENRKDVQRALELKYQNIPPALYKYRSCNKFALENLQQDEMWFNSSDKMNDPYDSALTINQEDYIHTPIKIELLKNLPNVFEKLNIEKDPLELKEMEKKGIDEVYRYVLNFVPELEGDKEKINSIADEMKSFLNEAFEEKAQSMVDTIQKSTFISCFSEKNDSMLMWSHYTENHEGFCIEYNFTKPNVDPTLINTLHPVIYSKKLFDISKYLIEGFEDHSSYNALSTIYAAISKSIDWGYEKEWRIVYTLGQREKGFNRKFFTPEAIYLGAKISKEDKATLMKIAGEKQISVYQMKLKKDEFKLEAEKIL